MTKEPDSTTQQFSELVASELTFSEIAAEYGEEIAINVGIARDPDNPEWTAETLARSRPAIEVHPHLVAQDLRRRRQQEGLNKWEVSVELDIELLAHFLEGGPGWQGRINDALRQAVNETAEGSPLPRE
jgi:uncharacterized protein (DUF4415 family)